MDKDRKMAREEVRNLPLKKRMETFWFYYKKHVIIGIIAFILIASEAVRCMNEIEYDIEVFMFTTNYVSDEKIYAVKEMLKEKAVDINENESVDVNIYPYSGDLNAQPMAETTTVGLMKLQAELVAADCPAYIVDGDYLDVILGFDEDLCDEVVDLAKAPQISEALEIGEGENLYWISMVDINGDKKDKDEMTQFDNARIITQKFLKNE